MPDLIDLIGICITLAIIIGFVIDFSIKNREPNNFGFEPVDSRRITRKKYREYYKLLVLLNCPVERSVFVEEFDRRKLCRK